ncbi:MAG: hypothetical protein Q7S92_03870 [Candidatus Diapherotrites archaeon]|nr:hypothetical protein [Candidatus Diapherotrites archaeon]
MPSSKQITTIQLTPETRERLRELGKKDETYDEIINRLVDDHEKRKK